MAMMVISHVTGVIVMAMVATIDSDSVSEVLLMVTLITPRHKHDAH